MARKRGMQFIPYDYEAAYNKAMEDMHEWFIENLFQHRKKVIYALKEITAGDQFEIEIYPQFRSMDEVPPEGRTIKKDNKAQKNLNDKNARKYVERLINENFSDRDIWMTLTYDDAHLPPDGDVDAAIKNVQKYIRRINYQRKKRGLPNAKYVYVTAYNPDAEIRWHHHIVMDGALDMETVESCWKQSSRNEVRRLQTDENGLSGMANYIVEEKNRVPSEKRWNSSQGLRDPRIKVVHSKRPATGGSYKKIGSFVDGMVKDRDSIPEILKKWYPDMDFTNANVYYNDFNCMQFDSTGITMYTGTITDNTKRTRFDYNGEHFYRDGKYVGKIGTNTMIGNDSQRGLVFDIEYDTAYMSWANKESANGSSYMMKWAYCTQQCNNYEANMLHAGADINMHYYKLRNVSFEDGAINGTLTFKQPLAVNSNGTLSKWSTATLTFKNGILISGAWSNG